MSLPSRAEVVVVGAGMSGCAVAAELVRQGQSVVVLERGPDLGRGHIGGDTRTARLVDPAADPCFRPFATAAPGGLRSRVGGRSLYWRGISLRIELTALADWPRSVQAALPALYEEVETELVDWAGHALAALRSEREASLLDQVRETVSAAANPTPRAVRPGARGTSVAFTPLSARVHRLIRPEYQAVAIVRRGDGFDLHLRGPQSLERLQARAVVLCAGTFQNAWFARHMSDGGGPTPSFPFADHHVQGWVAVATDRPATPHDPSVLALRDGPARSNVFVEAHPVGEAEVIDVWAMGEQQLSDATSLGFRGDGSPRFAHRLTNDDRAVLAAQSRHLLALADALGYPVANAADLDFDDAVRRGLRQPGLAFRYTCPLGSLDHESGTLALGGPWVDDTGKLRAAGRCFVAGPALFPRAGAANPSLTTLAVSRLVARQVLAAL